MSRAEEHGWYGRSVEPWTKDQLADYYRLHDFVVQQSDVVDGGVPTRSQLNAMSAMPGKTGRATCSTRPNNCRMAPRR